MSKSKPDSGKRRASKGKRRVDEHAALMAQLPAPNDPEGRGADLAKRAIIDAHPDLAKELEQLSPEEAAMFLTLIKVAIKKRRILLAGYISAVVCLLAGMMVALTIYSTREPDEFVGWAFLIPFILVGVVLLAFGRWARSL